MRTLFLFMVCFFICQTLSAQVLFPSVPDNDNEVSFKSDTESLKNFNKLNINQDPRLEKMLNWHVENNRKRDGMEGFRVEIFFSSALNAKERALDKKKEFLAKNPDYDVHIKFSAPNFRVRVGDFRSKNEAFKLLKKIQKDYPGAFIVPDIIDFPMLKQDNYERPN